MASQEIKAPAEASPKPIQFGLRSLFLATTAIAVAFGVLKWFGPLALVLGVQFSAVIAILVKSKGTAWPGVVIGLTLGVSPLLSPSLHLVRLHVFPGVALLVSFAAWL